MSFEYKEFSDYAKKFNKTPKEFGTFLKKFLLQQAELAISKAKKRTPKDTGFLRSAYTTGNSTNETRYNVEKRPITGIHTPDIQDIKVVGRNLQITIGNIAEYASYIEYGARGEPGKYMLTVSVDEVEKAMPNKFNREFALWLKGMGID